jgi:tRNA threonylcarbamoyladenosine biosynthesis protein TsaB
MAGMIARLHWPDVPRPAPVSPFWQDARMKLLALDTATDSMALALVVEGQADLTLDLPGGALASQDLIPQLLGLLAQRDVGVADLDAIAFGRGPGAFTGLRTAVSVAQGLAFGADKPVLAIDSLLLVADEACLDPGFVAGDSCWVLVDARMGEIYAGAYRQGPHGWSTVVEPGLYDVAGLLAAWQAAPPRQVCGSALPLFADRLPLAGVQHLGLAGQRAAALARLSVAAWQSGPHLPADAALPLYLRDKVAQTTLERLAARQVTAP